MRNRTVITKVGKRGVIVIPKEFRDEMNLSEGTLVILTLEKEKNRIILQPFFPRRVKLGGKVSEIVRKIKREEYELEYN